MIEDANIASYIYVLPDINRRPRRKYGKRNPAIISNRYPPILRALKNDRIHSPYEVCPKSRIDLAVIPQNYLTSSPTTNPNESIDL